MSDSVTSDPGAAERVSANIRIMAMACPLTCMADEMAGCWSAVTIEEKVCATKLMPKKVIIMAKTCDSSLPYDGSTLRIELQSRKWFPRAYAPSISAIRPRLIKSILGIGGQFFIITTSMLFIFQLMNVIISRNIGPDAVTEYNIAYKYLNSVYMIAVLILNPFWSAFTDAYTRGNLEWMRRMLRSPSRT